MIDGCHALDFYEDDCIMSGILALTLRERYSSLLQDTPEH